MLETAIVGAGPYGLSIAAHFRRRGIPFRIFGRPMDSWLNHMPKGMMLKSDGFASDIYDPEKAFTLRQFCAERGIQYADTGVPVQLDTFSTYGLAFRDRMVPELEDKLVANIDRAPGGFALRLEDGETFQARKVVLAVGITHFEHVPENPGASSGGIFLAQRSSSRSRTVPRPQRCGNWWRSFRAGFGGVAARGWSRRADGEPRC